MTAVPKRLCEILLCAWTAALLASSLHAQTRRALLIGIDDYVPPGAALPVSPAGHAPDSRFAPGTTWISLHGPAVDVPSMYELLQDNYGFKDIRVMKEQDATRVGILAAIDQLVADTQPGDLDVFYYSGHGSRRLDTLSSKDHFDQTIVPIDAWKGAEDIRDKELALRFDKIVFEKRAHLTAIYDSCDSATMARGITLSVERALPYDDRDVAVEKKTDPATVTEADLMRRPKDEQIPQDGDAIVLAAAGSDESAVEALYPDDNQFHGAFTRALVRVLKVNTQSLSAADVVAEVSNMLHADKVPFQQPSLEGRTEESLFGDPVAAHALHVHVVSVSGTKVELDIGSAAGFDVGTQFSSINTTVDKTVIDVESLDEALVSTGKLVSGPANVTVGQTFELTKMIYPQAARLTLFAAKPEASAAGAMAEAQKNFPGLKWVGDPALAPIEFLVVHGQQGWKAYDQNGKSTAPGSAAKGTAFLLLGPPQSLLTALEQSPPFEHQAFSITQNLAEANYLLAARSTARGTMEYALFDPAVLAAHKANAWVSSAEDDPDDAKLNGGTNPSVVCRNDVSLPVETAWLPDRSDIVEALSRRIVRLGKLRVWLQSPSLAPGARGWPYHLFAAQAGTDKAVSGLLHPGEKYDVRLVTTPNGRAAAAVTPMYVYLFGFDCAANPFLLYPTENLNGVAAVPQPGPDGVYPLSVTLTHEEVGTPLGADSLFVLATAEKLDDPQILISDGVIGRSARGVGNPFDELVTDMSDAGTRGPRTVPTNWLVQQVVLPSRP
jgi:Caspase domain